MPDDTRPARAAARDEPARNPQFRRRWGLDVITGPDTPEQPAHGTVWHSPSVYAVERAEVAWRGVGGQRR